MNTYVFAVPLQNTLGAVMDSPPLVEELVADPILKSAKLIAAVGDHRLLPREGIRGFPHYGVFMEWNMRFAGDVIALLRDNEGRRFMMLVFCDSLVSCCVDGCCSAVCSCIERTPLNYLRTDACLALPYIANATLHAL